MLINSSLSLPHMHVQRVKYVIGRVIVVVVVVIIVSTKIEVWASERLVSTIESVAFGEKWASVCFESRDMVNECHK